MQYVEMDPVVYHNFLQNLIIEDYASQLPNDDQTIVREYYIPIRKTVKVIRATLSGASKSNVQVLEEAVREKCVNVPEKRIKKIINILDKALNYCEPRIYELETGRKSGRLQSGICVPGSNCHYTKEYLIGKTKTKPRITDSCRGFKFHTYDHLSATKVISPIDLSTYTQMKIIEMVPGVINTNRVIYCTLIVDGYLIGSFHTVVEDDFGQCAKLSMCNTSPEFQSSLKKGANIAIANPYYKLGTLDECYFIRIDSPEDIIPIEKNSNLTKSEDHKIEGNKHFKAGEYTKAVSCYTNAIAKDSSNPVYLSNRALCYLKLDSFEDALQDAEAAVELDPNTHKYLYRLAMAWSGLGDHEKSVEILESIQLQENSDYSAALCKERKLLGNTRGKFDFDELAQKARSGEKLEIADFIGPIIIDKSKHGHGVFATRDIKKGELICVQRAIACLDPKKIDPFIIQETVFFANRVSTSYATTYQMMRQTLTERISKSKLSAFRFFMLFTKHTNSEPISIELYRSKGYELIREKEKPPFQMDALTTLIRGNIHRYYDPADPQNKEMDTIGIWVISSFFNHACLPNTMLTFYKDVCIVRAIVRIPKGSEVTSRLVSILFNVEERQAKLEQRGLFCDCELCEFESDPRNKTALERAVLLKERAEQLTDIKCNPEYPMMQDAEFELLNEAFSLAEEMKLGPTRFNMALWQAIQYLLAFCPKPRDHKRFLKSLYRAKSFLCDLELQFQWEIFDIWCRFNNSCQAPLSNECKREVREIHHIISSYLTYIP